MCPKPVDMNDALATLRRERPTEGQQAALLRAVARPPARRIARPIALVATVAAVATLLLLPPRMRSGSAWAQTLDATLNAPTSHSVYRDPSGLSIVEWRSGQKRTRLHYVKSGFPVYESRSDGKRRVRVYRSPEGGPNVRPYAVVDRSVILPEEYDLPFTDLPKLLRQPNLKVVSHTPASGDRPETYRLKVTKPFPEEYVAEIDPSLHRIVRLKSIRAGGEQVFDYPSEIANTFFDLSSSLDGLDVYDVATQNALIRKRQERGLGKKGPVTLRLVALDGQGRLWVHWTGGLDHLPPMGVSGPIRLVGVPSSKPQGTGLWFQNGRKGPTVGGRATLISERFARTMVVPRRKIGNEVSVEIPYPGGVARFKDVPVLRISSPYDYDFTFGEQPPGFRTRR